MARIFELVAPSVGHDSGTDQEREERARVLLGLESIIESDGAAEPAPPPIAAENLANDPVTGGVDPADVKADGSTTDSVPGEQIAELRGDSAVEVQSNAGGSSGQSTTSARQSNGSVIEDGAVDAATVDAGVPELNEACEGILAAVFGEAQQKAEVALVTLIERGRIQQAQQDAAEMASAMAAAEAHREEAVAEALVAAKAESDRVLEESQRRRAEESRKTREQADAEVAAAIDRVRSEEAERHATEVARVQKELEGRRVADLKRARQAVVESFSTLTGSIEHDAQG